MAFPVEIFRMQRRANFRVQMPSICKVSFTYHEEQFNDLTVHNLSLGGMLVDMPNGKVIDDAAHLGNIVITLQDKNKASDKEDIPGILISTGLAVRSLEVENNRTAIGVQFNLQKEEERELMQFVRRSELTNIRKGI
jgi:c-di-GMP-binding flagellar brake protein YcgR